MTYERKEPAVIEKIQKLKTDNCSALSCPVSIFAIAALRMLDVEPYEGDDDRVLFWISQGKWKLKD